MTATDPLTDPDLPLTDLLPLRAVVVTLHCLAPSHPRFFHQAALTALLRGLLRDAPDYDLHLRIDTPESGRVDYRPGDWRRGQAPTPRGAPPPLVCPHGHLFWVDNEYRDAEGADQVMGGLSGVLHLEGRLSPAWWRLLILGQYVGMGQRTAFGFGRYQLRTADGGFSYRRPLPAASLLTRAADADNLAAAWRHVITGSDEIAQLTLDPAVAWLGDPDADDPDGRTHRARQWPTPRLTLEPADGQSHARRLRQRHADRGFSSDPLCR